MKPLALKPFIYYSLPKINKVINFQVVLVLGEKKQAQVVVNTKAMKIVAIPFEYQG